MAKTVVGATDALDTDEPDRRSAEPDDADGGEEPVPDPGQDESATERAEDEQDADGDDAAPDATTTSTRRRWFRPVVSVLSVLAVGLAAVSIIFGVQEWQHHQKVDERRAATQAARQVALQLTSISYKTAEQDLQQLLNASTGEFRKQFAKRTKPFVDVVKKAQVTTTGEVVAAGVERMGELSVRVLVATHSEVKNTQAQSPQSRDYRLRITMTQVGERWLASSVEFVS